MFEYHGWAIVRDDTCGTDEARLGRIVEELRQTIDKFGDASGVTDVRWINGTCMLLFAGCPNHRHENVFALFPWLAQRAPGSYGLLYVWDDESREFENEFRVWRLLRGRVEEESDPFLSPCIPTIEERYDQPPTHPV
jgi:hypothetical protein